MRRTSLTRDRVRFGGAFIDGPEVFYRQYSKAMIDSSPSRFTRVLLMVAAGAVLLLIGTGSGWAGYVAVGLVFGVAVIQHAILTSLATRRISETIRREDPDLPTEMSEVAAAVRARISAERLDAERQNSDIRAALESAAVGVIVADREGRILNTVGATAGLVPPGPEARVKNPKLRRLFSDVLADGEPRIELVPMGASHAVMQWTAVPLDHEAVGAVVIDVTEVQRVQAMRRHFVTDASHELKTPIAAIQAAAEALQTALAIDEERSRLFARRLQEQAVRLGRIVNDLLDLSRLEGDVPEMKRFDLSEVVAAEVAGLTREFEEKGIRLQTDLEQFEIVGGAEDAALAVRNLLTNAIRYTEPDGAVEVRLTGSPGEVTLVVTDSGIGIAASDQERIFERFFRVDGARSRATGGTGLGLSIVRHVMANHGGSVEVSSISGRGSTFTLRFPVGS